MKPTKPLKLPFDLGINLDAGETVQRILYRHPFDLVPALAGAVALEAFSLWLGYAMVRFADLIPFPPEVVLAMIGITTVLAALVLIIGTYVYLHNILIFTNIHLIYVEQIGLFGRRVSQLNFRNVEDVTGNKAGIIRTIFNFGDVTVQSAGEQVKFVFHNSPDPTQIADDALQEHERCLRDFHGKTPQQP